MEDDQKDELNSLKKLKWLENPDPSTFNVPSYPQEYGDLTELNTERLILDSVGKELLAEINGNNVLPIGTTGAIYEKNGDYASIFSSGWCRLINSASRKLCPGNNKEALQSGQWVCHESCWECARKEMETKGPYDLACGGGIRIFALPIFLEGEVIGAINLGYTEPPQDPEKIKALSTRLKISEKLLYKNAKEYHYRPTFMIEVAKKHLQMNANFIEEVVARKQVEGKLQQKNAELNEFATIVSHDIRNPLASISLLVDILQEDMKEGVDTRDNFARMKKTIKNLDAMTRELLEFTRIGRKKIIKKEVNVTQMLDEIVACYPLNKRGILEYEKMPIVWANSVRLKQVFENLINNAYDFHPDPLSSTVRVFCRDCITYWEFCVEDDGLGIDPLYHKRIFKIFQVIEGKGERHGVGLAIVKKIIEEHGGQIWVDSELGKGAKFYFTLPKKDTYFEV